MTQGGERQYEFEYTSCVYGWSETGSADVDGLLSRIFSIKEAELFSEDAEVPPRRAWRTYQRFVGGIEEVCREYEAEGWAVDCGDFSGDGGGNEELAYEAFFERSINGETWVIYAVFKYFLSDGFGKSWLAIARTRETNEEFLNWLREWVKGVTEEECLWWRVVAKARAGGGFEVASSELVDD